MLTGVAGVAGVAGVIVAYHCDRCLLSSGCTVRSAVSLAEGVTSQLDCGHLKWGRRGAACHVTPRCAAPLTDSRFQLRPSELQQRGGEPAAQSEELQVSVRRGEGCSNVPQPQACRSAD